MIDEQTEALVRRLKSIEGHVRGVQRMLEEDAYCIDVLRQTLAIRRALEKVDALVLERHLATCVTNAIRSPNEGEREQAITEILEIFAATRSVSEK
ncbi:metal-sensitive transcriptional regulator [Herpetosiphon geysericola]|uniref:Copper-sensing transcriptional repressor CsoR family protein n=1 Tax=Herpetosiphon geysericola TaxID=70996 RepID=A0A0P6Y538_9CHLR|nr:metal-sensitive transcriptional regulator [Herpetosiphon geysericola]KPL80349.1 copper-sensing transcriptional repressor CsoR family protein [Herpetosiphon geysericola]